MRREPCKLPAGDSRILYCIRSIILVGQLRLPSGIDAMGAQARLWTALCGIEFANRFAVAGNWVGDSYSADESFQVAYS